MIIMTLDHARDFFHRGAMSFSPEDLTRTSVLLFFTRWVTHLCAPTFMFAAGVGAYFWARRGRTPEGLSRYLWTRGLWLVLLDVLAVRYALFFSLTAGTLILNVLWALGWSMVVLGFLVHLPRPAILVLSGAAVLLHNLFDPVPATLFGSGAWVWNLLHQPGVFMVAGTPVLAAYPLVPWFAVMALGYCFGPVVARVPEERRRVFVRGGLALTAAFLVLRFVNFYGDPQPWIHLAPRLTFLSFLRTTKYPPSLEFLLMTLGPALLIWAWLDRRVRSRNNPLIVFGRVPLFYFVLHLFVIHALTVPFALFTYGHAEFLWLPSPSMGGNAATYPPGYGYSLGVVYAVWLGVVILLYPVCRWLMQVKERRRDWWLSYL